MSGFTDDEQTAQPSGDPTNQQAASDTNEATQQQQQQADSQEDKVFLIAGDRAFRTKDDVVNNIAHAQGHIQTLEGETRTLRGENDTLKAENENLKRTMEALENKSGKEEQTATPSKDEIVSAAADEIENRNKANVEAANLQAAMDSAKNAYGENFNEKINELAKKNNMTINAVNYLAKMSPDAFSKLFLPEGKSVVPAAPTQGEVTSKAVDEVEKKTKSVNIMKVPVKERAAKVQELLNDPTYGV